MDQGERAIVTSSQGLLTKTINAHLPHCWVQGGPACCWCGCVAMASPGVLLAGRASGQGVLGAPHAWGRVFAATFMGPTVPLSPRLCPQCGRLLAQDFLVLAPKSICPGISHLKVLSIFAELSNRHCCAIQNFFLTPKGDPLALTSPHPPLLKPLASFTLCICPWWTVHPHRIRQRVAFCVWLFALSTVSSRFTWHCSARVRTSCLVVAAPVLWPGHSSLFILCPTPQWMDTMCELLGARLRNSAHESIHLLKVFRPTWDPEAFLCAFRRGQLLDP